MLVPLSAPKIIKYCRKIGLSNHASVWTLRANPPLA